jgi:hypothetical protein
MPLTYAPHLTSPLLVDGFHRAFWQIVEGRDAATLTVDRFASRGDDPPGTVEAIHAEGAALLAFVAPDAAAHRVQVVPAVG